MDTIERERPQDPFGVPPATERRTVVHVAGDHSLRTDLDAVGEAVRDWLLWVVLESCARRTS
jgi:hypothetical protein